MLAADAFLGGEDWLKRSDFRWQRNRRQAALANKCRPAYRLGRKVFTTKGDAFAIIEVSEIHLDGKREVVA